MTSPSRPRTKAASSSASRFDFAGSASLAGQVIVQDVPSISTLVEDNEISGNVTLTYNGLVETVAYTVSGWRETQQ